MPKPSLADHIHSYLRSYGPSHPEDIHRVLLEQGLTANKTAGSVRSSLAGSRFAFQLPDSRWDLTTRALAGVVLTVRPRSRLGDNVLWVHGDLEPFDGLLTGDTIPLLSGGLVRTGGGKVRTLIGPDGWLPPVPAGELLALKWTGHALDVFPVEQPVDDDVTMIRSLLRQHSDALAKPYGNAQPLATVLLSVLREAPDAFSRPQPPLSEIFPLPVHEFSDDALWESHQDGRKLTLHLPDRVYDELQRRARMLGERLEDHAAVLLGAASDRVKLVIHGYERPYDDDSLYSRYDDEVVRPLRSVP